MSAGFRPVPKALFAAAAIAAHAAPALAQDRVFVFCTAKQDVEYRMSGGRSVMRHMVRYTSTVFEHRPEAGSIDRLTSSFRRYVQANPHFGDPGPGMRLISGPIFDVTCQHGAVRSRIDHAQFIAANSGDVAARALVSRYRWPPVDGTGQSR